MKHREREDLVMLYASELVSGAGHAPTRSIHFGKVVSA